MGLVDTFFTGYYYFYGIIDNIIKLIQVNSINNDPLSVSYQVNQNKMIKLIKIFTLIFVLAVNPLHLFGQFSITVIINGLESSNGQVLLELSDENGKNISGFNQTIENKKCIIIIRNLKPGNYAFKYFHDENKNQKLDTNILGIPTEGFDFANDANGKFGPPPLEKTIFTVKGDTSLTCNALYY